MSGAYTLFDVANDELGKGNYDMAIECITVALELEKVPNKQVLMKTLVIAHEKKLDFASALEVMQAYVKAFPDDEEAKRELTFLETRVPVKETESESETSSETETESETATE